MQTGRMSTRVLGKNISPQCLFSHLPTTATFRYILTVKLHLNGQTDVHVCSLCSFVGAHRFFTVFLFSLSRCQS